MKFSDFGFDPAVLTGIDAMGFEDATPIQEKAIPAIMEQKDILACAQTGTGKTAAFLLPIIDRITKHPIEGIDTLILEPTRELVMQVDQQLEGFSYFTPVSSVAVYGGRDGHSMEMEKRAMKQGAPIVVATPGRFIAHLDLGYVDLSKVRHLVLDEADRMLDMGFAPDIMKIVHHLPRVRQTLLFSATMPSQIRQLARELMRQKPVEISIAISKPAENILQLAYFVEDHHKIALAEYLLADRHDGQRVIIFAGSKIKVKELTSALQRRGHKVGAVHSDLLQAEREEKLAAFKNGSLPIVVATDVLSRGIDIKGIDLVINFDVPGDAEDYVHRIGRTARADASGTAATFINGRDRRKFHRIEELIRMPIKASELPPELAGSRRNSPDAQHGGRSQRSNRSGEDGNRRRSDGNRNHRGGQRQQNPVNPPGQGNNPANPTDGSDASRPQRHNKRRPPRRPGE